MWSFLIKAVIVVVSAVISYVVTTKSTSAKQAPATFEDFDFPQCDEGTTIAYIFGDVWIDDWMVVGTGNYLPYQFVSPY